MQEMQADPSSIPWSGRSPGGDNGDLLPLQCFCLENPMDRGVWWVTVRSQRVRYDWTEWAFNPNALIRYIILWDWFLSLSITSLKFTQIAVCFTSLLSNFPVYEIQLVYRFISGWTFCFIPNSWWLWKELLWTFSYVIIETQVLIFRVNN